MDRLTKSTAQVQGPGAGLMPQVPGVGVVAAGLVGGCRAGCLACGGAGGVSGSAGPVDQGTGALPWVSDLDAAPPPAWKSITATAVGQLKARTEAVPHERGRPPARVGGAQEWPPQGLRCEPDRCPAAAACRRCRSRGRGGRMGSRHISPRALRADVGGPPAGGQVPWRWGRDRPVPGVRERQAEARGAAVMSDQAGPRSVWQAPGALVGRASPRSPPWPAAVSDQGCCPTRAQAFPPRSRRAGPARGRSEDAAGGVAAWLPPRAVTTGGSRATRRSGARRRSTLATGVAERHRERGALGAGDDRFHVEVHPRGPGQGPGSDGRPLPTPTAPTLHPFEAGWAPPTARPGRADNLPARWAGPGHSAERPGEQVLASPSTSGAHVNNSRHPDGRSASRAPAHLARAVRFLPGHHR